MARANFKYSESPNKTCKNECFLKNVILLSNALSICPDKIFFVQDKIILSRTKYFLVGTKTLFMA